MPVTLSPGCGFLDAGLAEREEVREGPQLVPRGQGSRQVLGSRKTSTPSPVAL